MPEQARAAIIAVGTELLSPFRLDTNSLFLAGRLADLGIDVRWKAVVGDVVGDIATLVRRALTDADVVLLTGGLGPTVDDVTREAVAEVARLELDEDATLVESIRRRFERRGMTMPEINRRQARVPRGATVLPNPNGTAPGLDLDVDGKTLVLLPGPPRELQPMFEAHVVPRLKKRWAGPPVHRRVIKITGRGESSVDEVAAPIYTALATVDIVVTTSILASPGLVELHLSGRGPDPGAVDALLDDAVRRLEDALAPHVFSTDGRNLETVVGDQLRQRGWRVAVAESCTAGLVLARLTEVAGSSAWVEGGIVAYDNRVKTSALRVSAADLEAYGAVSEPVARAMAVGVRAALSADVGLAVTGIAGPGGGSAAKPVGTVCIGLAGPVDVARTFTFPGDRQAVRAHAVAAALDLLRRASNIE